MYCIAFIDEHDNIIDTYKDSTGYTVQYHADEVQDAIDRKFAFRNDVVWADIEFLTKEEGLVK